MRNNSLEGNCSSFGWQNGAEKQAFATFLHGAGYKTMFAGKCKFLKFSLDASDLNMYGFPGAGGTEHVPPGWDRWVGLVGNSVYYSYTLRFP